MAAGDGDGGELELAAVREFDGASNVLVLSPTMSESAQQSYFETLVPSEPVSLDVLAVDYRRTASEWLEEWERNAGGRPQSCVVVSIDEATRSSTTAAAGTRFGSDDAAGVENPGDLTGLGITVSEYLADHAGPETLVTFDSLTVLLQYVDLQRAFRFLHVLANRTSTVDALAHYHMDPAAHTDQTVATLSSLFDAVAEFEDGEWTLRSR